MPSMPNVVGMNYAEAVLTLTEAGVYIPVPSYAFLPDQITVEWLKSCGRGGIILAQEPLPAELWTADSELTVDSLGLTADGALSVTPAGVPITLTVSTFPMASVIGP